MYYTISCFTTVRIVGRLCKVPKQQFLNKFHSILYVNKFVILHTHVVGGGKVDFYNMLGKHG